MTNVIDARIVELLAQNKIIQSTKKKYRNKATLHRNRETIKRLHLWKKDIAAKAEKRRRQIVKATKIIIQMNKVADAVTEFAKALSSEQESQKEARLPRGGTDFAYGHSEDATAYFVDSIDPIKAQINMLEKYPDMDDVFKEEIEKGDRSFCKTRKPESKERQEERAKIFKETNPEFFRDLQAKMPYSMYPRHLFKTHGVEGPIRDEIGFEPPEEVGESYVPFTPDCEFEELIKSKLIVRGFSAETLLNNRGLIGAVIDETILAVIKDTKLRK